MPWPSSISQRPGSVEINKSFSVSAAGDGAKDARVQYEIQRTFERLSRQTGIPILPNMAKNQGSATLAIVVERKDHRGPQRLGDDERYSLEVNAGRIRLSADAPLGVIFGLNTFLQLVHQNASEGGATSASPGFAVSVVSIRDEPRFPWRGLSLDVSRHFIPVEGVKRTIDGLSAVKLNVFHWHLSDDQGFRVQSKKFPRLQEYGSDGMYYTQAEVRDVVEYARNRGVRVVPEFDIPGHATSWLAAYPKLGAGSGRYEITRGNGILADLMDPTKESTYRFLDGFVGEMVKLFPDEYFHIGGDEVNPKQWNQNATIQAFMRKHKIANSQALQVYFNQRLLKIVTKHGKKMEGWDEIFEPALPKNIVIQSWRGQASLWQAAREGYQGILSAGYYLDLMYPASYHYSVDPMKAPPIVPGHEDRPQDPKAPAPGTPTDLAPAQQKLVLGGEATMWEEIATAENLDAKLWPRLAAVAERLWSPEAVTDLPSMYRRLEATNSWLEWLGLTQRTNLELMRRRLAGSFPSEPLNILASVLEPVKGYSRHAEKYNIFTPFNRLVDSISPESEAAREFRNAVDRYLAGPKGAQSSSALGKQLQAWAENAAAVRPTLQSNSLLNEDLPLADALVRLCRTGQESLAFLETNGKASSDWKAKSSAAIKQDAQQQADMLIRIAPAIQKLVDSAPSS